LPLNTNINHLIEYDTEGTHLNFKQEEYPLGNHPKKFEFPNISVENRYCEARLKSTGHATNQADAFRRINILLSGADEYLKPASSCQLKTMSS
jgi:hypothetical protein